MATISRLYPTGVLQTKGVLNEVFIPKSGSAQFVGALSKYLTVPANSAFTLGTNDHTIEFWMYQTVRGNYDCPFSYDGTAGQQAPNNYYLNVGGSQFNLVLGKVVGSQWSFILGCGTLPSLNAWHHYAIVRIGNTFTVYVDGIAVGAATPFTDSIAAQGGAMVIGAYDTSGSSPCTGYITNFRVVNGVGVYTGNFPVPKTPFNINQSAAGNIAAISGSQTKLLLRHENNGGLLTDSSPNNFTVTNNNGIAWSSLAPAFSKMQYSYTEYKAIEFDEVNLDSSVAERRKSDGTHQISGYYEEDVIFEWVGSTTSTHTPTLSGATVGTTNGSPFATSVNSYQIASQPASIPYNYVSVPGESGFAFGTGDFTIEWFQKQTTSSSFPRLFWYGATPTFGVSEEGGTFYFWSPSGQGFAGLGTILNTWVHFAIVRIGTSLKAYRNGVLLGTAANAVDFNDTGSTFYIGSKANTGLQSEQFIGSITNFRICKGLGVYTGNFTVPTSPLGQTQSANPYGGSNTSGISAGQCTLLLNP